LHKTVEEQYSELIPSLWTQVKSLHHHFFLIIIIAEFTSWWEEVYRKCHREKINTTSKWEKISLQSIGITHASPIRNSEEKGELLVQKNSLFVPHKYEAITTHFEVCNNINLSICI